MTLAPDRPAVDADAAIEDLEDRLSRPPDYLVRTFAKLDGDVIVLGVAGKMGVTLARMARRAFDAAGVKRDVVGVARFSNADEQRKLDRVNVRTIRCDLLDHAALNALPAARNVIYMAGMKFGSSGNEALTWAMNTYLPGMVCERYADSRIVAFSTGNVYGLSPVARGGSVETDAMAPSGDYAMSCAGRERIVEHFSRKNGTPTAIIRLNYACEPRYGVLEDLARKVWAGQPIDLTMGNFNVIWQADANAMALASLAQASSPPYVLNVAGPELLSTRRVCQDLARKMNREVSFVGTEAADALLNNGQKGHRTFGYPTVSASQLIDDVADWVMAGAPSLNKPTHFETRDGKY